MWYMWAAWDLGEDESYYVVPSATYANDGRGAAPRLEPL